MKFACKGFFFSLGTAVALLATSLPATAATIFDDDFADGDQAKTGALDTNWWTSSSSSGDEIAVGSLGLVTGGSGRGLHTVFAEQTLGILDRITATYTFETPATVGNNKSTSFRVGLFDGLGQAGLDDHVSASSGSPNALYGWGVPVGGPGTQALPGYMLDMDVNTDATADLNFREHTQGPGATGRLMSTTTNFAGISPSGPDEGYTFEPNTTYTGSFEITRINATEMQLRGRLGNIVYTNTDEFDSDKFSFLGFHVNSSTFGSSSSAGDPDNGIDFSNIKIEVTTIPEPSTCVLALGALLALPGLRRRR